MLRKRSIQREAGRYSTEGEEGEAPPAPPEGRRKEVSRVAGAGVQGKQVALNKRHFESVKNRAVTTFSANFFHLPHGKVAGLDLEILLVFPLFFPILIPFGQRSVINM